MNISGISTAQNVQSPANNLLNAALVNAVAQAATADGKRSEDITDAYLKMILLEILFSNGAATQQVSPTEQAAMIEQIMSSGVPGAVSRAMGATSYSATGAPVTASPVGAAMSVTA